MTDRTEAATVPIRAVVLLSTVPPDMANVFDSIQEGMGASVAGVPLLPDLSIGVNGAELRIGAFGAPVTDPGLRSDLATSPLRQTLEPAVAQHVAAITLGVAPPSDFTAVMTTWLNVLAYLLDRDDAAAVWLPYQSLVNTDVMFIGMMERDPAVNMTATHAARWSDEPEMTSLAFTRGLAALGGRELQWSAPEQPATLFQSLQAAVSGEVGQGRLPQPGGTLTVGGASYQLADGVSLIDGNPVLNLVAGAPEPPKKKLRWPFG